MARSKKYHGLAAIALFRLNETEIRALHELISEMSAGAFLHLIRDLEDELSEAVHFASELNRENLYPSRNLPSISSSLYHELDNIRKKKFKMSVYNFSNIIEKELINDSRGSKRSPPVFDSRRGLKNWINKLVDIYGEETLFNILDKIIYFSNNELDPHWKLK